MNNLKIIKAGQEAILEIKKSGRTKVKVGKNASVHIVCDVVHQPQFSHDLIIELVGRGAKGFVTATFRGTAKDRHNFNVILDHQVPGTKGDVLVKGVFENESSGLLYGLIKVAKNGLKTDSFLRSDVLLLDKGTSVSKPTLEIANDDVKASHGSTTSNIDANQLYYLQSRGLTIKQSKQLIIEGFFKSAEARLVDLKK